MPPEPITISSSEWASLPLWGGLDFSAEPGTRYRATYRGQDYVVTVIEREDKSRYSMSRPVVDLKPQGDPR